MPGLSPLIVPFEWFEDDAYGIKVIDLFKCHPFGSHLCPDGVGGLCPFDNVELVVLANKKNSPYIQLSTKNNMQVGFNQEGEEEHIAIEKYKSFVLTFEATMFMGCQYESISPEVLLVGKLAS